MNKNHMLVWNKARGSYVVAGENARRSGKGKTLACATVIAVSVLAAGSVSAGQPPSSSFTNPDVISVGAEGDLERATGLHIRGDVEGESSNSGTIRVEAYGDERDAKAKGVSIAEDIEAKVTNSGTIAVSAHAGAKNATAVGLHVEDEIKAQVINSGTISASAEGSSYAAHAAGIEADELGKRAVLTNTGLIEASVEVFAAPKSVGKSGAYAIRIEELDGKVINSGTLRATGSVSVTDPYMSTLDRRLFALYAEEGKGSVTNELGGVIDGRVVLGEEDDRHRHEHGHKDGIDLTNHGLLDIRTSDSRISGDYMQSTGGMLKIERAGEDEGLQYGNLRVGGTATLERGTQLRVKGPQVGESTTYERLDGVVRARKFEDLDVASLRITDNILAVNFVPELTEHHRKPDSLDLYAVDTGITTIVDAIRQHQLTSAEQLAGVLDELIVDPDGRGELTEFLYRLGSSASPEELANRVAEALPLANGATARATLAAIGSANRIVQSRIEGISGRSSGDDAITDHRLWLKPFGTWAKQDASAGAPGYDADTTGIVVGFDRLVGENSRLGAAFAYSNTDVDANTDPVRQRTDISSYQLSLYGTYSLSDRTDVNFLVGVGTHDNDGQRSVSGSELTSRFDSTSFFAGMGLAHTYTISELTALTPSVRLDYARLRANGYTEEGGTSSQIVDGQRAEELVLGLDGKLSHALNDKATLVANLGVGYDLINDRDSATAAFVGAPDLIFTAKGGDIDAWLVRGGLGVVGRVSETVELTARYDIEGRDGYTNQTASLKLRKSF
ncbi:MAG: autotransporter domain-containing protein [Thauera sp.]|nr:autotransporter domain-containing protein [Thauera sp.]